MEGKIFMSNLKGETKMYLKGETKTDKKLEALSKRAFMHNFVLNRAIYQPYVNVDFVVMEALKAWKLIEIECKEE
jgi:hypothetical protein